MNKFSEGAFLRPLDHRDHDGRFGPRLTRPRSNRLKVLWFDRNGYCILYKRLHRALFELPESGEKQPKLKVDARTLGQILLGVATRGRDRRETHEPA